MASGDGQQPIALVVERNGANLADRLVLDIGQPGIDLEIFQQAQHVGRRAGLDAKAHVGIARAKRRRQRRHHAEHGRDRRDPDLAGELVLEAVDLLPHRAGVADDAPRPVERALAFRRKALKARAALHQHDAEDFLELLEAGRHRRLGDAAGFRGPSEMPLLCERQQKFKLVDQRRSLTISVQRISRSMPDKYAKQRASGKGGAILPCSSFYFRIVHFIRLLIVFQHRSMGQLY